MTTSTPQCWLMKTEPGECSIDDVYNAPNHAMPWFGIRNYQARNFMRDTMKVGDLVLFYHSSCKVPGIVGLARIASKPYPDATQFDNTNEYFDPKSTPEKPRWVVVDVEVTKKCEPITLATLKADPRLSNLLILRPGNRLSITPVTIEDYNTIINTYFKELP